ncbi:MAG TPA: hypothetical protein VLG16_05335 [Candidatus Saccharimonadales bacterium]|nr:hypothetical protein [Candidatus Saccharimonadales bacterium]
MSQPFPEPVLRKLPEEPLWQEANQLADFFYSLIGDFPDTEQWYSAAKIRSACLDMLFYTSEALGSPQPSTAETDWSHAAKAVSALRAIYPFTGRQGFTKTDPDIVLRLDKMLKLIGQEVSLAHKHFTQVNAADLDLWREKYKIWKKIDDK